MHSQGLPGLSRSNYFDGVLFARIMNRIDLANVGAGFLISAGLSPFVCGFWRKKWAQLTVRIAWFNYIHGDDLPCCEGQLFGLRHPNDQQEYERRVTLRQLIDVISRCKSNNVTFGERFCGFCRSPLLRRRVLMSSQLAGRSHQSRAACGGGATLVIVPR